MAAEMENKKEENLLLQSWLKPSVVLPVIGILIAIYYSTRKAEPVFYFQQEPYKVFDQSIFPPSDLQITYRDSILVHENIYSTSIVLWNKGKLPIGHDDIRDSIRVQMPKGSSILSAEFVEEYADHGESNFRLLKPSSNAIPIQWDYFDPGSAGRIQLLYTCNSNIEPTLDGAVLGASVKPIRVNNQGSPIVWLSIAMMLLATPILGFFTILKGKGLLATETFREKMSAFLAFFMYLVIFLFGCYWCYVNITMLNTLPF